ncbi:initiation factor 2 [Xylariaceae sp. FL1651]|nr:initiation factor 2 [Xylariaceae sp. FL1651]
MLRGRLAKRDSSLCALCQYRLSQRFAAPRQLLFSTTQCARNNDSRQPGLRPVFFFDTDGDWGTPRQAPTTGTTDLRLHQSGSSSKTAESLTTKAKDIATPVHFYPPQRMSPFRPLREYDLLSPHETRAREQLLAKKVAQQAPQLNNEIVVPRVKARYVWNAERQQAIERTLRADRAKGNDKVFSKTKGPPSQYRVPLHSKQDVSPSLQFGLGQSTGSEESVNSGLLSLAASGTFWGKARNKQVKDDRSATYLPPLTLTNENQPSTKSQSSRPNTLTGDLTSLKAESAGNDTETRQNGWAALEAAGDRDAKIKLGVGKLGQGSGPSQEWGQLARRSTNKIIQKNDFWDTVQDKVTKPTATHTDRRDKGRVSDPWEISKTSVRESKDWLTSRRDLDPGTSNQWDAQLGQVTGNPNRRPASANDSLDRSSTPKEGRTQAPWSRNDGNDYERNKRRDPFVREERPGKRYGKRSQRGSRFDDDEDFGNENSFDQYQEKRRQKEMRKAQREADRTEPIPIILPELISVTAFANALKIKPEDFLVQLGELGFEGVTLDSLMAGETAALVAQEYGYEPTVEAGESRDLKPRPPPEDPSVLPSRPPVVTIMGHVDHGKTTLLDYLRKSSVAAQEHGGITQHIGAFSVKLSSGKPITFLDTPGHAAFLTMRQRGANVTDIVVLVVAADDSVKPQTLEALKHARAAKVPIIVAINKIDKDGARVDAVKHDLAQAGVEIEDFGGDVQVVCVSGKTGQGMDDLEENILTLSEILDHRAEPDGPAEGWILESTLKPTGKVATVLVKRGTLRPGDYIAAGLTWAKIRQLRNEAGVDIDEAPPGTPVEILGWKDLPAAGDQVIQSPDEDKAKTAVSYREGLREREKDAAEHEVISEARKALQEKRAREKIANKGGTGVQEILPEEENGTKMVNFVVKGDVHGSVEAVCAAIQEIGSHEVRPRVLRSATGPISEFDVEHAATSKSVIVNFATTTPGPVRRMAEKQGVRILDHTVIYHLVDDVKANLSEYLAPDVSTHVLGEAEVLQIFPINVRGRVYKNIAGCRVRNGVVAKNSLYRVLRKGEQVFDGKLETLKHVKKDVQEMRKGAECGMGFEEFQDLEIGDQIQAYEVVRTARSF